MNVALPRGIQWRRPELGLTRIPRKRVLVMTLLWVFGIAAFGAGLLQTKLFAVERIDVTGTSQLSRDDVLSIAKLHTGGSIASVNTRKAEQRLEAYQWVLHARIDADWPHVLSVTIVEQRAVALAQTSDKKWAQLGPDGTVLRVGDKPQAKLPAVIGVSAPSEVGKRVDPSATRLMSVATLMPQSLQPRVVQMQDQGGMLRLGLDAGTVVVLGDANDLAEKLLSAASVIAHTDPKTLAELDVTSPRFPVARPTGQSQQQTSSKSTTATTQKTSTKTTQKPSTNASTTSSGR